MSAWRVTWTQRGQRHGQDYADRAAAEDAAWILASNYAVKDVSVNPTPAGEAPDFSGPRPLTGGTGTTLLDQTAWKSGG